MNNILMKLLIIISLLLFMLSSVACSLDSKSDGKAGTYYLVYEDGPIYDRDDSNYKMVLDGKGSGEYHKGGNIHKIRYKLDDSEIEITDKLTGIVYKGTVSDGQLHVYDGRIGDDFTSEFLFEKNYTSN